MRQSRIIRCDLHTLGIEIVSLYTKCSYLTCRYTRSMVYKILLETSGLKKSVAINHLPLKPMSLNPKFTAVNSRYNEVSSYPRCVVSNRFTSNYNELRLQRSKLKSQALRYNESLLYISLYVQN